MCQTLEKREEREFLQMDRQERKGDLQVNSLQTGEHNLCLQQRLKIGSTETTEAPFYRESLCPDSQLV